MPRKPNQPAEGGSVREPIKEMLAGGSDKDFKESLPDVTSSEDAGSPEEMRPRKKRRSKEEIARERGDTPEVKVDKRLERAKGKAAGLGAAKLVESGFAASGKPLNEEENEDVGDQFYLIATKAGVDPSGSWLFLIIYTIALLARLVLVRTELGAEVKDWLKEMFEPKPKDEAPPAPTVEGEYIPS